jgi:formate dehydrogenase subunit gamma
LSHLALTTAADSSALDDLIAGHAQGRGGLLPLLHDIIALFGFIDDAIVPRIALAFNQTRAEIHGVVTFYHDFRRKPAGRHIVRICRAESCQARGGAAIEALAAERLGVAMGKTRADGQVTLEPVYCLGLCATGPNALVDGRPVSRIDAARIDRIASEVSA